MNICKAIMKTEKKKLTKLSMEKKILMYADRNLPTEVPVTAVP